MINRLSFFLNMIHLLLQKLDGYEKERWMGVFFVEGGYWIIGAR